MVVCANLCGKWTDLLTDDYIEDEIAQIYVNEHLSKKNITTTNQFLRIHHENKTYYVHISQIQWYSHI